MICTRCGTQNPKNSKFCLECGKKLMLEAVETELDVVEQPEPDDTAVAEALHEALKCYERGRIELAFVKCRHVLRMKPDSTSAHSLLALIYEKKADTQLAQGSKEEAEDYLHAAIRQIERILDANPESEADREKLDELVGKLESASGYRSPRRTSASSLMSGVVTRVPVPALAGIGTTLIIFLIMFLLFGRSKTERPNIAKTNQPQMAQSAPPAGQPGQQPPNAGPTSTMPPAWSYTPPTARNAAPPQTQPTPSSNAQAPQSAPTPAPVKPLPEPVMPYPVQPPSTPKPAPTPAPKDPLDEARAAHRNKDYAAAAKYYEQAISNGQDSGEIEEKLGMCYYNLGKRSEALSHFQRAIQLYTTQKSNGSDVSGANAGIERCRLYISALSER